MQMSFIPVSQNFGGHVRTPLRTLRWIASLLPIVFYHRLYYCPDRLVEIQQRPKTNCNSKCNIAR